MEEMTSQQVIPGNSDVNSIDELECISTCQQYNTDLLHYQGTLNGHPLSVLIDGGSSGNFCSESAAKQFTFSLDSAPSVPIIFANGATSKSDKQISNAQL